MHGIGMSSLLEICGKYAAKNCSLIELCTVLSYEFQKNTTNTVLTLLPLNRAIAVERLRQNALNSHGFWKLVSEKCQVNNFALTAKLKCPVDVFELEGFEWREDVAVSDHIRQILLNCLFQEALCKCAHSDKKQVLPSFPMHTALGTNSPDCEDWEWLMILAQETSCFHFYPHHAKTLFENRALVNNIGKHAQSLDLKLNITVNVEKANVFNYYYSVLHWLLTENKIRRVSIHKLNVTVKSVELLLLCLGKFDNKIFCESGKERLDVKLGQNNDGKCDDDDIWDDALGEGSYPANQDNVDLTTYTFYTDFVVDEFGSVCSYHHSNGNQNKNAAELELDLEHFGLRRFSSGRFISVLSHAHVITKLAVNLFSVSLHEYLDISLQPSIFNAIDSLLLNPLSNLHTLKLDNFELSSVKLSEISMSLCMVCEKRKCPFEKLAFVNCRFTEEMYGPFHDYSSNIETIVRNVYIENAVFESDRADSFFTDYCVNSLNPITYCVIGACRKQSVGSFVNIDLLYDALHSICPHKISTIENVCLTMSVQSLPVGQEEKFVRALSRRYFNSFHLCYNSQFRLSKDSINTLRQHANKLVVKHRKFQCATPGYSRADYISQM